MDISETIQPDSDQLDAVDLLPGPRVFTITNVSKGPADQPVQVHLAEFPRPWRPGKSMRRVLVAAWGPDASTYIGRQVRLFCDPRVSFGGVEVGGVRIAALSHIKQRQTIPLLVSRGRSAPYVVEPLTDDAQTAPANEPTAEQVAACEDPDILRGMWQASGAERRTQIEARVAELTKTGGDVDASANTQWDEPAGEGP